MLGIFRSGGHEAIGDDGQVDSSSPGIDSPCVIPPRPIQPGVLAGRFSCSAIFRLWTIDQDYKPKPVHFWEMQMASSMVMKNVSPGFHFSARKIQRSGNK